MKVKTQYVCQNCGFTTAKWLGRCPTCESWNTFAEEKEDKSAPETSAGSIASVRDDFKEFKALGKRTADIVALDDVESKSAKRRIATGMAELDRTLGGGLVPDAFTLLGGDPGIGKSTLLLQLAKGVLAENPELKILYVSGEESLDQIAARAKRMGVEGGGRIFLAAETSLERVFANVLELKPNILFMDSLQTFSTAYSQSAPGSVSQVREITTRLMTLAKTAGVAVWLVGHVTKEGAIAGPKTVEHMVDTVLYFEGEGTQSYRLLRTVKNRFGSTNELGVFEMDSDGLKEVRNPSSLFLSERKESVSGVAITASLEGSRPLLVELQSLVVPSGLAVPRRTAVGIDGARLSILAAILERHMGLALMQKDLFFNVSGGLRISEPAVDLAAAAAIWSSMEEVSLPGDWLFLGELALTGEVRRAPQMDVRIAEAKKLGFSTAVVPENTPKKVLAGAGLRVLTISRVRELAKLLA
ncbi:MAG: DNA repair protein RadA [Bdellovibrionales bacterium]|nr:DNA repair protein RadA [Bdellovibrionales bacterium]